MPTLQIMERIPILVKPKQGLQIIFVPKQERLCRNVAVRFIAHYIYCRMNPTATTYCGVILEKQNCDIASGAWERDRNFNSLIINWIIGKHFSSCEKNRHHPKENSYEERNNYIEKSHSK